MRQIKTVSAIICLLTLIFTTTGRIYASSVSLNIHPSLLVLNASIGQKYQEVTYFTNQTKENLKIIAYTSGFSEYKNTNHPIFIKNDNEKKWINIQNYPKTVDSNKSIKIKYSVNIPQNASAGSHMLSIIIKENSGQISVSLATLIIVNIAGNINVKGVIDKFYTPNLIMLKNKVPFTIDFHNYGNIVLSPSGFINIYNLWGKKVTSIPINSTNSLTLPGYTREYSSEWNNNKNILNQIGYYKAKIYLTYGVQGQIYNVSDQINFIEINWKEALITLLILIIFGMYIIRRRK